MSVVLVGFGLDSVIECAAAGVLLWRLLLARREVDEQALEAAEGGEGSARSVTDARTGGRVEA